MEFRSKLTATTLKNFTDEKNFVGKITDIMANIGFIADKDKSYTLKDHVEYLLKACESAEPATRSKIENHLVKLGRKAVPMLVSSLYNTSGSTRGLVAMVLIRIGGYSIKHLENAAKNNSDVKWISDYIIREIEGSKVYLGDFISTSSLEAVLVG